MEHYDKEAVVEQILEETYVAAGTSDLGEVLRRGIVDGHLDLDADQLSTILVGRSNEVAETGEGLPKLASIEEMLG